MKCFSRIVMLRARKSHEGASHAPKLNKHLLDCIPPLLEQLKNRCKSETHPQTFVKNCQVFFLLTHEV